MTNKLTFALLLFYIALVASAVFHKEWAKALYWLGAILIALSLIFLK